MPQEITGIALPVTADELDFTDDVYIDTRYPGNFGILPSGFPKKDEAVFLFGVAEKLYKAAGEELIKQAGENHSDTEATRDS